jgi:glutamine synthetase
MSEDELAKITHVPESLGDALNALEEDHEFLLKGDVFTKDLIETYIAHKREEEVAPVAIRPHPWEFALYYDA